MSSLQQLVDGLTTPSKPTNPALHTPAIPAPTPATTTTAHSPVKVTASSFKNNKVAPDYPYLYKRSAITDQRWPWTRLHDVITDTTFYRHETEKIFQGEMPEVFNMPVPSLAKYEKVWSI